MSNFKYIEIEPMDQACEVRNVGDRKAYTQTAYAVFEGERHPIKTRFGVPAELVIEQKTGQFFGYPPGHYQIDPSSIRIGKYDKLEINPFELRLIKVPAKAELKTA